MVAHLFTCLEERLNDCDDDGERKWLTFKSRLSSKLMHDTYGIDLPTSGLDSMNMHSKEREALFLMAPAAAHGLFGDEVEQFLWGKCIYDITFLKNVCRNI